jgi:hypothetical protein
MNDLKIKTALLMLLILSGCASVPMASPEHDAYAKNFTVVKDQSRIYLFRNENLGSAVRITVALDGKIMGQTAPKTYFYWNVAPGIHEVSCMSSEANDSIRFTAEAGEPVYIWQEMKMGAFSAGCQLHRVKAEAAQGEIRNSSLAVTR